MIRIVAQTPNEMVLDDGINLALIGGAVFIVVAILLACYFAFSYSSAAPEVVFIFVSTVGAFSLVGIAFLFSASWITLVINKSSGSLVFYRKRLFRTKKEEHKIGDIQSVEWRLEYRDEKWNDIPATSALVVILRCI
jgi:hypothetical protein